MKKKPKIALIISADLLNAVACLPLLSFLEKESIVPDLTVTTDAGGILYSLWSLGYRGSKLLHALKKLIVQEKKAALNLRTLWKIVKPVNVHDPKNALYKADKIQQKFASIFKNALLEELNPKTVVLTTDAFTAEPIWLERGPLSEVLYASQALFPLYPPQFLEGRWLISGSYSAPLPISIAVDKKMDFIIAIRADSRLSKDSHFFLSNAWKFMSSSFTASHYQQNALAVAKHHYEIEFIHVVFRSRKKPLDVGAIPSILEEGERVLQSRKARLLSYIKNFL